jgi:hypothetical protein
MGKMGSFKVKGLEELQKELESLESPEAFIEGCAKELAARLLAKVIKRTPVGQYPSGTGKVGGTLRRGWTGGQKGGASYAASLPITHVGNTYVVEITNPVEYASYVEFGHQTANHKGWVEGKFMMTESEQELEQITPAVLEAKIKRYLSGCLK